MTIRLSFAPLLLALAECGATDAPSTVPAPASDVAADPTAIRPFEVHIPDAVLDDLKHPRLVLHSVGIRAWGPRGAYRGCRGGSVPPSPSRDVTA